jgi:hypothetical protein
LSDDHSILPANGYNVCPTENSYKVTFWWH